MYLKVILEGTGVREDEKSRVFKMVEDIWSRVQGKASRLVPALLSHREHSIFMAEYAETGVCHECIFTKYV